MTWYLGVDGGGTKTQTFLMNLVSGQGYSLVGEASNPNSVGWDKARERVLCLLKETLQHASAPCSDLSGICIGMAGIDRKEQIARFRVELSEAFPGICIEVVNDALPAITAGTEGEPGIVLIAGTGSICVGEDEQGHVVRSGGYGYLIGDEGSGFDIGRRGILAAIQSAEGRGPKSRLWPITMDFFKIANPGELVPKVYESVHPVGTIASFAKVVIEAAEHDFVAGSIIDAAVMHYQRLIESVSSQLSGLISKNVVLSGGLFTNTDRLAERVRASLTEYHQVIPLTIPSAAGAALRAIRADAGLNTEVIAQWRLVVDHIVNKLY